MKGFRYINLHPSDRRVNQLSRISSCAGIGMVMMRLKNMVIGFETRNVHPLNVAIAVRQ
ncbi:hypothetical protein FOPG_17428 [Fusarium oxysporum f. sp. conglutinans race 2 54008]|uniref:Uncharacterized protein n=1 Tax=Fusarium oxysporum f. sp. conglutinans race 2 54008 TaxID=1089457 RepID=X0HZ82_FUSOX|nr:hypothetical protein FOPG_17428 [Fusarium oxysporum f. sp. conglutinans race 2 54008]